MSDKPLETAFNLEASLQHALGTRTLVLDDNPVRPSPACKAMSGSGRTRNPTTPSKSVSKSQGKRKTGQMALAGSFLSVPAQARTPSKLAEPPRPSAPSRSAESADALAKMQHAVAELRALRTQFPDLPFPDELLVGVQPDAFEDEADASSHLFDDDNSLQPPFEDMSAVGDQTEQDYATHPFVDDEAIESRGGSPDLITPNESRHGYHKDDFVVSDGSGEDEMSDVDNLSSHSVQQDQHVRLSPEWEDIVFTEDQDVDANVVPETDASVHDDREVVVDSKEDLSIDDMAKYTCFHISDDGEDETRYASQRRLREKEPSVDEMQVDSPVDAARSTDVEVYEEDLPAIPYPSSRKPDNSDETEDDWDTTHVIRRAVMSKTSPLYTFYNGHPNRNLAPAHLVTMAAVERDHPLWVAMYDSATFRKPYRETDLIPFLKMLRFHTFGDITMIGNVDPSLFTTEKYTANSSTGKRLVWLENRRNVLNFSLGVCCSSHLRSPYTKLGKNGKDFHTHTLLLGVDDQTYRLMAAVLSKVFAFQRDYISGPVVYLPEMGNSVMSFSTLPAPGGMNPNIQWTSQTGARPPSSPLSSVKAPVLGRARLPYTHGTGVEPYTQPIPIFDGRYDFAATPEQLNSMLSRPPTAPLFGDGHTEIPKDAVCLVAHTVNTWQAIPQGDSVPYPPTLSLNIQYVVVLALPAALSGLYVKEPSTKPGTSSTSNSGPSSKTAPPFRSVAPSKSAMASRSDSSSKFKQPSVSSPSPSKSSATVHNTSGTLANTSVAVSGTTTTSKGHGSFSKTPTGNLSVPSPGGMSTPKSSHSVRASNTTPHSVAGPSDEVLTIRLPAKSPTQTPSRSGPSSRQSVTSPISGTKRTRSATAAARNGKAKADARIDDD
ncbi:hypothetical protein BDZ89DRAFT_1147991 [Hymenopellis radicata]|nr:hypothetical protein BDZ89DRAFT_1147991 [Hymenopellis radicata]